MDFEDGGGRGYFGCGFVIYTPLAFFFSTKMDFPKMHSSDKL